MKILYGWFILIALILFAFYYVNLNLEKTVLVDDFLKLNETPTNIAYSVKNVNNKSEIISLNIDKNSEIIVLSSSEKKIKNSEDETLKVKVNRAGKNVILILLSSSDVTWEVLPSDNTNIDLIVFNNPSSNVVSKTKIYKKYEDLEYIENVDKVEFLHLISFIKEQFKQKKISYFYKQINNESILVDITQFNDKLSLEYLSSNKVQRDVQFELLSKDLKFIKFNLYGPIDKNNKNTLIEKNVTFNPSKTKIYKVLENGIKIKNIKENSETIKPIPVIKKIFNSKGIAYDRLNDRVFVAGKFGKFYVFDANEERWLSIRKYIDDFDINSLSYDLVSNVYLSSTWKNEGILIFDHDGNFVKRIDLINKLKGLSYYYDKGIQDVPQLYIVGEGNDIALVLINDFVEFIWLYDEFSDKVTLTYNYYDM